MRSGLIGQIVTPAAGNWPVPGVECVADNGIYSQAYPGDDKYLSWLAARSTCEWAVAPDVVADHEATLDRSGPMLDRIRDAVGGVALCAQNGATPHNLPWDAIDTVFLAGILECVRCGWVPPLEALAELDRCSPCGGQMREWKLGPVAAAVTAEAHKRGVSVHMGRVNSFQRLRYADTIGCHSADGTYLAFGPDVNLGRLLGWLEEIHARPSLPILFEAGVR